MSRYIIDQEQDGFVVRGRPHPLDVPGQAPWLVDLAYQETRSGRQPVHVERRPYLLRIQPLGECGELNFFDLPRLLSSVAKVLMSPWNRVPLHRGFVLGAPTWLQTWAIKRTMMALTPMVRAEWQRMLAQVDSTVLAVHKKVFAAAWGCKPGGALFDDNLYKHEHIVHDIVTYRAAAVAALACEDFGLAHESPLERMTHWRDLFAPAGMGAYTSLNKTLMNLPGGLPASLLCDLRNVILPRPILNRLELATTILAGNRTTDNFRVFAHASAAEIAEVMRRLQDATQIPLSPRRTRNIGFAVRYLLDFPEDHHGRLVGLAEKAIRWHRADNQEHVARRTITRFGADRKAAAPPISLPEIEGVRFLATVGDIVDEGNQMGHCIASYSERAAEGRCYLFHVDHAGETASVEVDARGRVAQALGPRNCSNKASHWGRSILDHWGRGFPATSDLILEANIVPEDDDFLAELNRLDRE